MHSILSELTPALHPRRSISLINLTNALGIRFEQKADLNDLDKSIQYCQQILELIPSLHSARSASLTNLANALVRRFEQKGDINDLEECIQYYYQALELTPAPHPSRSLSLSNLAIALGTKFKQKGDFNDLEESIQYHQQALDLTPAPHPERSNALNNLANTLVTRFQQKGDINDLNNAITSCKEALNMLPSDHPRQTIATTLGHCLVLLYTLDQVPKTLEDAMDAYRIVSMTDTASLLRRFKSAHEWALQADRFHHTSASEAFQYAINLLPLLASLDMSLHTRQEGLVQTKGFASRACSWAIRSGRLETAVEYLSAARAIFWSQALSLRTPLDDLEAVDSALAKRLQGIASELEYAAHRTSSSYNWLTDYGKEMDSVAKHCRYLSEQWNSVLKQVRKLPGFEDFLLPAPFSKIHKAALNGPIVLLNADETGCDALLVDTDGVQHIPIPNLTLGHINALSWITQEALVSKGMHANLGGHGVTVETDLPWTWLEHAQNRKISRVPDIGQSPEDKFHFVLKVLWFAIATPIVEILNLKVSIF